MAETPIIDAAIRAGCEAFDVVVGINSGCVHPSCECYKKALILAALRAGLPFSSSDCFKLSHYNRLMRELYPERFRA